MGWTRFLRRSRWDAERAAEIEAHIRIETDDNIARGMDPESARAAAVRKLGSPATIREEIYRMNSIGLIENFARDVAYGLRSLRKSPGFAAVAILSLALGTGANTAIFSLVDTLMLRSLPAPRPAELVQLAMLPIDPPPPGQKAPNPSGSFSYPIIEALRDGSGGALAGLFAYGGQGVVTILLDGRSERVVAERVGGACFDVLGLRPALGRTFSVEQDRSGAEPLAVISYGYWERRFGRDTNVLGKTFQAGPLVFTIAGVTPPRFGGIGVDNATDIFVPYTATTSANRLYGPEAHKQWSPRIMARLRPGRTQQQALAELNVVFAQIMRDEEAIFRATETGRRVDEGTRHRDYERRLTFVPGGQGFSDLRRQYSEPLLILMTVVGLVLLIACANIGNLLLARAAGRRREIAVRLATGAGRGRLLLQLITEGMLLSTLGALAGLVFAFWAGHALVRMVAGQATTAVEFQLNWRVLAFTAAVAMFTGLMFSLGPAVRASRLNVIPALKNEPAAARPGRLPIARVLVVSQVMLSLTLLLTAVLFIATLSRLRSQYLGFRPESVLIAGIEFEPGGPSGVAMLPVMRDLAERVEALPGVTAATVSDRSLFGRGGWTEPVYSEAGGKPVHSNLQFIAPNFFDTMRTPILLGRAFTWRDDGSAPKVVIINETLARSLFPETSAAGKRLKWKADGPADLEIVGVVTDLKKTLRDSAPPFVFLPLMQPEASPYQKPNDSGALLVRTAGDPSGLSESIRRELQAVRARPGTIRTHESLIDDSLRQEKMLAQISGFFGLAGLLLAAVGLYGLMAYTVSRRIGEMGIRVALGARPGDLIRLVLGETAMLVLIGIAAGIGVALAVTGVIESFLFNVRRTDPAMTAIAAALMISVAMLAALVPAGRAARADPLRALRHE